MKTVLTLAGSDPLGGAGIQADIKTIQTFGGYALSVITAINAQNSQGVQAVFPLAVEQVAAQLDALLNDVDIDAIKLGQLASPDTVDLLAQRLQNQRAPIVLDPVIISSSGQRLLDELALAGLLKHLMPLCDLITPNIPEVNTLLGAHYHGRADEMHEIGQAFFQQGIRAILVKGGHSDEQQAVDYLLQVDQPIQAFSAPRLTALNVKGTGCFLSSAIATLLAQGETLSHAIALAKQRLHQHFSQPHSLRYQGKRAALALLHHQRC
jgi:hydroxymethylpyrimidine/phosphomethylpyrimidine kinase